MTDEDVRDLIRKTAGESINAWSTAHGLSRTYVGEVLRGLKPPGKSVLDALGLHKRVVYEPKTRSAR